jgi:hypothetical protein
VLDEDITLTVPFAGTANQLHRQAQFHEGQDPAQETLYALSVKIDAGAVLLK